MVYTKKKTTNRINFHRKSVINRQVNPICNEIIVDDLTKLVQPEGIDILTK